MGCYPMGHHMETLENYDEYVGECTMKSYSVTVLLDYVHGIMGCANALAMTPATARHRTMWLKSTWH